MQCHAWLRYTRGIPNTSSDAANEGTRAHEVFEKLVTRQLDIVDVDDPELADGLGLCLDWVNDQAGIVHAEVEVDFGAKFGFVDLFGTSDIVIDHSSDLTVADLKYGRGLVEVAGNTQLMIYLSGAVAKFGRRPQYRLAILQPRGNHPDGPTRECIVTNAELDKFEQELGYAISMNYHPRGNPKVGDHCRAYCKALGSCPAVAAHSIQLFRSTPV
jgi:hypothetical protein